MAPDIPAHLKSQWSLFAFIVDVTRIENHLLGLEPRTSHPEKTCLRIHRIIAKIHLAKNCQKTLCAPAKKKCFSLKEQKQKKVYNYNYN